MRKIVTSDYHRALRLSLILHVVIMVFAAVDIFNLFNQRPIEALADVSLVTEADFKQISQQIKQNQQKIQEEKPIAEPEPEKSTPEKSTSTFASAMALINKNIKELAKTEPEPLPVPKPEPKAPPKPTPPKPKEEAKALASPDNKKPKIDKIDLSNLVIDSSQQNETGNKDLQEIEESTQKIAQNIAQNAIKPIEPEPEPEPEPEIISEPELETEPELVEEIAQTPELEISQETPEPEPEQEVIEQEITEQEIIEQEVIIEEAIITDEQASSDLESDLEYQELVILREQISTCWNPPLGAKNIDDLVIRVQIELNEQGVLTTARILHRFGADINDPYYRAATESALRAVRHPNCTPLKLPKGKYDIWKKTILTFNPTEILP
ncbi:MAG: hypothetical protein K0U39_06295 [Alphaproteobacteria bacterium]|nr:hypothetical protein [Alphaproteobacteria bacterium]